MHVSGNDGASLQSSITVVYCSHNKHYTMADSAEAKALLAKVTEQGNAVRELKSSGADKDKVMAAVGVLKTLKAEVSLP